ncbi:MAG: hypothetical protein ACRDHZ_23360, partial [Ktedonobacteraceae bacterium]
GAITEAQYRRAKQSYENALKQVDQDQVTHEFDQMRELADNLGAKQQSNALQPPKEEFDTLVQECVKLNTYARQHANQPHNAMEMAKTIEEQKQQGERAFAAEDQQTYSDAIQMLESIQGYLYGLLQSVIKEHDTRSETEQIADYIEFVLQQAAIVELRASEQNRVDLKDRLQQVKQKLEEAGQLVESNPNLAWASTRRQNELLEEMKKILNRSGQQYLDLKGLVEKRHQ